PSPDGDDRARRMTVSAGLETVARAQGPVASGPSPVAPAHESKRPSRAGGRSSRGAASSVVLRLFFGCLDAYSIVLRLSGSRLRGSGGRWGEGRDAPVQLRLDHPIGGLTMLLGPRGEERGAALGDDPGVLAWTTLDQATTTAWVDCLMADLRAVHGAISVFRAGPGTPGSRWSTLCVSDDYIGMGTSHCRVTTDDVDPCSQDGDRAAM